MKQLRQYIRWVLKESSAPFDEEVFRMIRDAKLFGSDMPRININDLAHIVNNKNDYATPREMFTPQDYVTFDDWFLRELTPEARQSCIANASDAAICSPVEGEIRSYPFGGGRLKSTIIGAEQLDEVLMQLPHKIQISLKKCDYHHVHSPCDGVINEIFTLQHGDLFPESESMMIFHIGGPAGNTAIACIGEQTVQTFEPVVNVGDRVAKMDKLGYFYFGSQILMGVQIPPVTEEGELVFPGDPLCYFGMVVK